MNRSYIKGYRFERRVKKYLEEKGFKVFRLAGSKPADLIAIKDGDIYIIECKVDDRKINYSRDKLIKLTEGTRAKPLFALRSGRRIIFMDPHNDIRLTL